MATGNVELMHEGFPKHLRMGTARMKYDVETEEEDKRRVNMERSTADRKKIFVRPNCSPPSPRSGYSRRQ